MNLTKEEVINIIEDFINGKGKQWDWDDFISIKLKDNEFENIRLMCSALPDKFPPTEKNQYCSPEGVQLLKKIIFELKRDDFLVSHDFEKDLKEIKQKELSNKIKAKKLILLLIAFVILLLIIVHYK